MTYTFYEDPGHGWLEVERAELAELGIEAKITRYSYQSRDGTKVYLEEDCDLATFLMAKGYKGYKIEGVGWDKWLGAETVYHNDNRIRGLPHLKAHSESAATLAWMAAHEALS